MEAKNLSATAQRTLAAWHDILERNAMEELGPLLSERIVFRSPVAHRAYPGRTAICLALKTVNSVFQNFRYHRSFVSEDGTSVVLEFSASVEDKLLKGIDMLRFDDEGKIVEFEVMARPMSALQALASEMGKRLAPFKAVLSGEATSG
ncbi:nuclear transport factor 2 family protein [Pseudomonas akapageensis]|uniref:nuclear transport factor 2 family protein n=1 Tax=Pseudomonas akapageensis TaxID=2609961 RepID=UPI00140C08B8|nr:nuclear transport factor 2 family protein [Pseudomonas akapageensis]